METLVSGHPWDARKVLVTGAGRLREYKTTEFDWELRKAGFCECPFTELPLHLKAFYKEGNHFGVQTTVCLLVMDKCLIPGRSSSIPRYRDLTLELGSEPNPLVCPKSNPLVRDLCGERK